MTDQEDLLIKTAQSLVGIVETGGPNQGPEIEVFQRTVDGVAHGEPWCMAFIQYCLQQVDWQLGTFNDLLFSESCLAVWNDAQKSKPHLICKDPRPGLIVIYQRWEDGKPTWQGHCGIIEKVIDPFFIRTIEGNTSPGPGINRDGDGVYRKNRSRMPIGQMRIRGYLSAWGSTGPS